MEDFNERYVIGMCRLTKNKKEFDMNKDVHLKNINTEEKNVLSN